MVVRFLSVPAPLQGLLVLAPVNLSANGGQTALEAFSLSNIENGSYRMFAHMISGYLFTFVALWQVKKLYRTWIIFRVKYFKKAHPHHVTVLVREIPDDSREPDLVKLKFNSMYEDVKSVVLGLDTTDLAKAIKERDEVRRVERMKKHSVQKMNVCVCVCV